VAETVEDRFVLVEFDPSENVMMMSKHRIGAGIDRHTRRASFMVGDYIRSGMITPLKSNAELQEMK
jgi:hypothetical protein